MAPRVCVVVLGLLLTVGPAASQIKPSVSYHLTFPEPHHRLMQVEATFTDVPAAPLQVRMSRSSPGRYAVHEFAKNVFDVRVTDAAGMALTVARPNPHQWDVTGHRGTVRVRYRVFGDRTDGTYLGVDSTHAHINMPAALMWARGLEDRPATLRFEPPAGSAWRVGTQLFPSADPLTYTAPNLQYLMDSPAEFSAFSLRTFTVPGVPRSPTFRMAVHHDGSDQELDAFARDAARIVTEARHVFGEYPEYEGNTYTFIADYLPWANGDGMEHRNSTILTSTSSIRDNARGLLDTVSHEFFHSWNVERIRPASLEPFDLEDANMSRELWFAEGFTNYYGPLVMARAGLTSAADYAREIGGTLNAVMTNPGRRLHSAEEMSQMAPFVDAAAAIDRTSFDNTYLSYYTFGEAIGLGLDLTLRDRSNGAITLDHYMRALWATHGKPGGRLPGYVDHPYTMADLERALASVSGDAAFARDFFARFIRGRELVDYGRLVARAGLVLRPAAPGLAFAGQLRLQDVQGRTRIVAAVPFGSPAYAAGLERDDIILSVGGVAIGSAADFERSVRTRKPGETVPVGYDRRGARVIGTLGLIADPRVELVLAETAGRPVTDLQKQFRQSWLGSAKGNAF